MHGIEEGPLDKHCETGGLLYVKSGIMPNIDGDVFQKQ